MKTKKKVPEEWEWLRRVHSNFLKRVFVYLAVATLFGSLGYFASADWAFGVAVLGFLLLMVDVAVVNIRDTLFQCPRCGNRFYFESWYSGSTLSGACRHCGLRKWRPAKWKTFDDEDCQS